MLCIRRMKDQGVIINNCMGAEPGRMNGGAMEVLQMLLLLTGIMMRMMQLMSGGGNRQGGEELSGIENENPQMTGYEGFSPVMGNCIGNFIDTSGNMNEEGQDYTGGYSSMYQSNFPQQDSNSGSNSANQENQNYTQGYNSLSQSNSLPQTMNSGKTGNGAVDLAKKFLGRVSKEIKGELPNFTAAGGYTNNCADFVSSCLENQGLLKGHFVNVERLEEALIQQGYKKIPPEQAKAGDVWIGSDRGHTELVEGVNGGNLKTIGSNNIRQGFQVISERDKDLNSGVVYSL